MSAHSFPVGCLRLGIDVIEELDTLINVGGPTPFQAADCFLRARPDLGL
ncbi:hypothetical protein [Kitasatospora sp. GP82]|nr:hypothetical protein [Kitasatospora sp. GP82]MDH6125425.1 hypothetical protein [Kitasatospora sp. GP82]